MMTIKAKYLKYFVCWGSQRSWTGLDAPAHSDINLKKNKQEFWSFFITAIQLPARWVLKPCDLILRSGSDLDQYFQTRYILSCTVISYSSSLFCQINLFSPFGQCPNPCASRFQFLQIVVQVNFYLYHQNNVTIFHLGFHPFKQNFGNAQCFINQLVAKS